MTKRLALALLACFPVFCRAQEVSVSAIFPSYAESYMQAWRGFKDYFKSKKIPLAAREYNLKDTSPKDIFLGSQTTPPLAPP